VELHWRSIEVRHGAFSAHRWRDQLGESLFEMAVTHGARDWGWVEQPWGLVFEVGASGAPLPRHPRLPMGAGAAPLPETPEPIIVAGRSPAQ
jgi:hypothetical protein